MGVMSRFVVLVAAVVAVVVSTTALAQPSASSVTATQLKASFKRSTGDKLVVNRKMSYPGHYTAFDAGVATIARKGKYGTFTVYLVTGADVEAEVKDLLADARTGVLEAPGAGNIYWEAGRTLYGDLFWLAKKRYGENVVLWWIGSKPVKKTDKTFKRLHTTLLRATR
jgi:hypothetical protein